MAEKDGHAPPAAEEKEGNVSNAPPAAEQAPAKAAASNDKAGEPNKPKRDWDKGFEEKEEAKHATVDLSTLELKAEDLYDKDRVRYLLSQILTEGSHHHPYRSTLSRSSSRTSGLCFSASYNAAALHRVC